MILSRFTVNGHGCCLVRQDIDIQNTSTGFNGQKIQHPYWIDHETNPASYSNQPTIDSVDEIIKTITRFDIKFNGSCGALVWSEQEKRFIAHVRFDIRRNKKTGELENKLKTKNWIPCEPKPENPKATHWPHFRPLSEDPKAYKHYITAWKASEKWCNENLKGYMQPGKIVTIEYMGKQFNETPADPMSRLGIVIHGSLSFEIPVELRTMDGLKAVLTEVGILEGLVLYPPEGSALKLRSDLFGIDWQSCVPSVYTEKLGIKNAGEHGLSELVLIPEL